MKKLIAMLLACVMVLGLVACGGNAPETTAPADNAPETTAPVAEGPEAITLKVWAPQEDQVDATSWLCQIQAAFEAAHPEYAITWENGVCPEGDAATMVTADPAAAADVYMFANDHLGTLIQAGALAKLGGPFLEQVQNDVSATYVNTVTSTDGSVYGFPVAPNTWFMYYNKALVGDADLTSMESILEKGVVAMEIKNSWYLPAFFFAAGGTLFGETGADAAAGVQFGGEIGVNATNAVLDLLANPNFVVDGDGFGNAGLKDGTVAAYFSGSWDYAGLYEALGENLGAVAAPTVMMNGAPAQLKAYAGSKAVGVNPNAANPKAAMQLAAFLASPEGQLARYELSAITPAATACAENEAVKSNFVVVTESAEMAQATIAQPTIAQMASFWDPVKNFGLNILNGSITKDNVAQAIEDTMALLNSNGL